MVKVRKPKPLKRADLPTETVALARFLIGATIVHELPEGPVAARIVETEAYLPDDAASHTFRGETKRNRPMFGERGHAYVYLNYGVFWLFNVSSEKAGIGAGVLVRAVEPLFGVPLMQARRPGKSGPDLTNGPGKLTLAMGIGPQHSGLDLCARGELFLAAPIAPTGEIGVSTRIGLTKEAHRPLRFFERGNPFLSGPRKLNAG
ncbi:Putative 3-methyladenine DNA glycosylase [Alphaproteobacteria bacterium SO-S41]|nr:Putative 3-methyladenine DNA glycosylase [Alphaproteobacteria bacterium SO-S41]